MYRQCNCKCGSRVHLACDVNITAMIFDETVAYRQSQTDAFDLVFRGKKTIKNFAEIFFRYTHAGVGDDNIDIFGVA